MGRREAQRAAAALTSGAVGVSLGARSSPGEKAMTRTATHISDAIVVGAGVIGAAIAFELAKKGWNTNVRKA